ncbi:MAG TPA: hypothetical protein VN982_09285 [Candidatus Dormibacteraeota bacterium]|nr:hypothetical protein [Candidatus Dormibacteraeota bacterium]
MKPFLRCPKCGVEEYGVLNVSHTRCERRCRACRHTATVYLPQIKKKVVYIDQFAFSNIMKFLSPEAKGHERAAAEPFWKQLFETLDVVRHLQLVACPDSREHQYESLTSPFYKALKHTYEHFSGGVSFQDAETIRIRQIAQLARAWLKGEPANFDFSAESISSGRLHEWSGRIFVTVDGVLPGTVDELRIRRGKTHRGLQELFEQWQREKKSFKEVFEAEKNAYGERLVQMYAENYRQRAQMAIRMMRGQMPSLEDVLPSRTENIVATLQFTFAVEAGNEQGNSKIGQFFKSGAINDVPFNRISAAMYASLASMAAAGQKEIPNQGTATDINIVSTLLPYCDAMFVDNKCRALLHNIPKDCALPYACKVFSPKTGLDFIQYLSEIRDSVELEHLRLIEEVYGPDPLKPQSGIFGLGKHKLAAREC